MAMRTLDSPTRQYGYQKEEEEKKLKKEEKQIKIKIDTCPLSQAC